ncbi:MAG: division/cell wall cluster transcriptional repressor MraZ [Candidatus Chlorobium antarcticum]|nr:division/cell wall cluster transcriptional repressor MraZ [Candidatus Chlorobium antarcticum]
MAGFIGKERHSVDDKGRLMIPARFRRKFADAVDPKGGAMEHGRFGALYVMKTSDGSLELYEPSVWEGMGKSISALSDFNPEERLLKTLMYECLEMVELDRQGRVPLSREFLDHAGISGEVVILGADTKMIVWEPERLRGIVERSSGRFTTLAGRYF